MLKKLKVRWKWWKSIIKMPVVEIDNKKYLIVIRTGWNKTQWTRYFEIVEEIKTLPIASDHISDTEGVFLHPLPQDTFQG